MPAPDDDVRKKAVEDPAAMYSVAPSSPITLYPPPLKESSVGTLAGQPESGQSSTVPPRFSQYTRASSSAKDTGCTSVAMAVGAPPSQGGPASGGGSSKKSPSAAPSASGGTSPSKTSPSNPKPPSSSKP